MTCAISNSNSQPALQRYSFLQGAEVTPVHPERAAIAAAVDTDHDNFLSQSEVMEFLIKNDDLEDPTYHCVDQERVVEEFGAHLTKTAPTGTQGYHTYDQMTAELTALAEKNPEISKLVSLGKTPEGRDIWALKISSGAQSDDTRNKPGIVITGCHHAREWMSMEVPMKVANDLIGNYESDPITKGRVDKGEFWIVPMVNPDGYEYSRTTDNWWRKNRRPVEFDAMGKPTKAIGVDLNRNYDDGKPEHATLYRPVGDTPGSTYDDYGKTSDNPNDDTYRGPSGASEPETKALLALELGRGNIKGILDHHGYGEMMLFPWGAKEGPTEHDAAYRELTTKMNKANMDAGGRPFRLMQSRELYPTAGGSHDIHEANGIQSFTLEVGKSFQPKTDQIKPITTQVAQANYVFVDDILAKSKA
jgi:carboxypeptidase T